LDNKKALNVFKNDKGDYILFTKELGSVYLKYLHPILKYDLSDTAKIIFKPGNFIDIAEPITEGVIDIHELLQILFNYHILFDGIIEGTYRSLIKFQLLLINSIQSIYQSQGVNISSKHIEIIVKQMTSKVVIKESGDTPLLPGELTRLSLITEIYKTLLETKTNLPYKIPKFEPILRSATNSSLSKDGFLSSAGFQETKRVLTKAAIEGSSDWLRGLKESIIIGRLIPAGSSFLNYKNYLDNIYLFKNQLKNNTIKK
jgi:DNA-directed RNA polymerase subunit beta'